MSLSERWRAKIDHYQEQIDSLQIPENPSEVQLKQLASRINELHGRASFDYGRAKSEYFRVEQLISTTEAENKRGNNEDERKKNAIEACKGFETKDGRIIDLYDAKSEAYYRKTMMEEIVKHLKSVIQSLTLSYGVVKMEIDLQKQM